MRFLIDYFTGSKFRMNKNTNLVILMMLQPQNYNFGSHRPQILKTFMPSEMLIKGNESRYRRCGVAPVIPKTEKELPKFW